MILVLSVVTECRREIAMQITDLEFSISISRDEYRKGEPVPCKLALTNRGSQTLYVNKRMLVNYPQMQHDVYFEITDENGKKAPIGMLVNAGKPKDEDFEELEPDASVSKQIDLARDFKLDPGSYTFKAVYENSTIPSRMDISKVWKGKIESNTLNITIR
jgi:hypothetical protein